MSAETQYIRPTAERLQQARERTEQNATMLELRQDVEILLDEVGYLSREHERSQERIEELRHHLGFGFSEPLA